jgi:hypothetical protein
MYIYTLLTMNVLCLQNDGSSVDVHIHLGQPGGPARVESESQLRINNARRMLQMARDHLTTLEVTRHYITDLGFLNKILESIIKRNFINTSFGTLNSHRRKFACWFFSTSKSYIFPLFTLFYRYYIISTLIKHLILSGRSPN